MAIRKVFWRIDDFIRQLKFDKVGEIYTIPNTNINKTDSGIQVIVRLILSAVNQEKQIQYTCILEMENTILTAQEEEKQLQMRVETKQADIIRKLNDDLPSCVVIMGSVELL